MLKPFNDGKRGWRGRGQSAEEQQKRGCNATRITNAARERQERSRRAFSRRGDERAIRICQRAEFGRRGLQNRNARAKLIIR